MRPIEDIMLRIGHITKNIIEIFRLRSKAVIIFTNRIARSKILKFFRNNRRSQKKKFGVFKIGGKSSVSEV
jgi:hypothetical protein